jgi:hypothetical protein
MSIDIHPKRKGRTPEEITKQQKEDAEALRRQKANVPAKVATVTPAPTTIDTRTPEEAYLDEIAPSTLAGQMIKFSKEGQFIIRETQEAIGPDREFVALCEETLIGWVKFNGEGEQPDRRQGQLYHGFVMPPRDSLGDMDQSQWPEGLSGAPEDPWHHQMCLVLQDPKSTHCSHLSPVRRRVAGASAISCNITRACAAAIPAVTRSCAAGRRGLRARRRVSAGCQRQASMSAGKRQQALQRRRTLQPVAT